jgi:hypothetical protein
MAQAQKHAQKKNRTKNFSCRHHAAPCYPLYLAAKGYQGIKESVNRQKMELLPLINVICYVTTYLKGGAYEHKTAKPFPNPYPGSFDSHSNFIDIQLEWFTTGIPSGKQHKIGDH